MAKNNIPLYADGCGFMLARKELSFSGIHWPQIDEDLSFTGMFIASGLCDEGAPEDSFYYLNTK